MWFRSTHGARRSCRSKGQGLDPRSEMIASARCQLAGVGDLVAGNGANLRGVDRRHGGCVAIEGGELDLKCLAIRVDMNHSPHVAGFQTFLGDWRRQNDPVMFSDHADVSLLARVGRHQARRFQAPIDDPDGSHHPAMAAFSLRRQRAVDNIFLAMGRLDAFSDFSGSSHRAQSINEQLRSVDREPERLEKLGLSAIIGMCRIQQVVDDLVLFDSARCAFRSFTGLNLFCHERLRNHARGFQRGVRVQRGS